MNQEIQKSLQAAVAAFHLPRFREIPDVGLRLEQVARYVSRYVTTPVTTSMVSNYVKQKTIPGPVKKCYTPESIAYLIFVSYIKTVVSMEEIRFLVDIQRDSYSLQVAYDYFCDEFENLLQYVSGLKSQPDHVGQENNAQKELMRTALLSITYKVYLNEYLKLLHDETPQ